MSFNDPSRASALRQYFQGDKMNPDVIAKNRASLQAPVTSCNPTTRELLEALEASLDSLGGSVSSLREQLSPILAPTPVCGETGVNDDGVHTSEINYQLINILKRVASIDSFVEDIKCDIAI